MLRRILAALTVLSALGMMTAQAMEGVVWILAPLAIMVWVLRVGSTGDRWHTRPGHSSGTPRTAH